MIKKILKAMGSSILTMKWVITYQYRLELSGMWPTAEAETYYVVLTDNKELTIEDVSKSLYSSLLEDVEIMEDSVIVEMKWLPAIISC